MAWTPKYNVFDARFVAENLFEYFKTNQTDALFWANNNSKKLDLPDKSAKEQIIKPIPGEAFYLSPSTDDEIGASITLLQSEFESLTLDGTTRTLVNFLLEFALIDGRKNFLAKACKIYQLAFSSMARNCPEEVLMQNQKHVTFYKYLTEEIEYDVLRSDGSKYLQAFQMRLSFECDFSDFN